MEIPSHIRIQVCTQRPASHCILSIGPSASFSECHHEVMPCNIPRIPGRYKSNKCTLEIKNDGALKKQTAWMVVIWNFVVPLLLPKSVKHCQFVFAYWVLSVMSVTGILLIIMSAHAQCSIYTCSIEGIPSLVCLYHRDRCGVCGQVRIQDLVKGGAPASEAESCRCSETELREQSEHSVAGVQGP